MCLIWGNAEFGVYKLVIVMLTFDLKKTWDHSIMERVL